MNMHQSEFEGATGYHGTTVGLGLWYDAEKLILEGIYLDEVSAYRARRVWIRTFEANFLLEELHDFKVKVLLARDEGHYHVQCTFTSACGRYAFWRLTHHQAPEVQFILETAHQPHVAPMRFVDAVVEPEADALLPSTFVEGDRSLDRFEAGASSGFVESLKRHARNYLRKVRYLFIAN